MTTPQNQPATRREGAEEIAEAATAWFVRMNADGVTAEDRLAFRKWLDRDQAHRDAYADAESLWRELGGLPDPRKTQGLTPGTQAGGTQAGRSHPRTMPSTVRRRREPWYAALAASLLLAVAVGFWSLGGYDRLRADHVTAIGETREVTLQDGSVLHLNTDTALAVEYSDTRRRIGLFQGEAYFTVSRDQGRPFEVTAGQGMVRAVGTAFAVHRNSAGITVAVAEGRVQVGQTDERAGSAESVLLGPGDALRLGADGKAIRRSADVGALTAWRQGKLVFADRPLRAVIAELDRYRPGAIVFLDSAIAEKRFSGVMRLADTDQALAAIEGTLPVEVIQITDYLTVLRARE